MLATLLFVLVESSSLILSSACSKHRSDRRAGFTFHSSSSLSSSPKSLRISKIPFARGFAPFVEPSILISLPRFSTLLSLTDGNSSDQDILLSPTTTATSLIIESNPSLGNALIDEAESRHDGEIEDDAYFERMFDALSRHTGRESNKNNEMA